jgi:hypothetical protein
MTDIILEASGKIFNTLWCPKCHNDLVVRDAWIKCSIGPMIVPIGYKCRICETQLIFKED